MKKTAEQGGILLSFDDYSLTWLDVLSLLDEFDGRATFYFSAERITEEQLTLLRALIRGGHEIGWHTRTHSDMVKIPMEERNIFLREEIEIPLLQLRNSLGIEFPSFAYPFGSLDSDWEERLSGIFSFRRGFGQNPVYYKRKEMHGSSYFDGTSIDNIHFEKDARDKSFSRFCRSLFTHIAFTSDFIFLGSHGMNDDPWGITPDRLIYLLSEAKNKEVPIFSVAEAFSQ